MRVGLVFLIAVFSLPASAQTFQTDGSWNTASNWNPAAVPSGATTSVTISANPTISSANTIGNVTDGNNVTISVQSGGSLTLGSSALFANGSGTYTNMTYNNNGTLQVTSGGTVEIWGNLVVNNNLTLQVTGTLIVHGDVVMADNGVVQVSGGGSVSVSGNLTGGQNATLQVSGSGSTLAVGGALSLGGGHPAIQVAGGGIITAGSCSCTSCSPGSGCSGNVMPVTLLFFKGALQSENIALQWVTASEINFDHFELEKSEDGRNFRTIATIKGHGTTNVRHNYEFEDLFPVIGSNYYRLRSIDFDGYAEVFNVIEVSYNGGKIFSVYPNPITGNSVFLSVNMDEAGAPVVIYNSLGVPVAEFLIRAGTQEVKFPTPLSKGTYYARFSGSGLTQTVRFIVL